MKPELQTLCDQFMQNREVVAKAFFWSSSYVHPICANVFCSRGKMADKETLKQCKKIIDSQTGIFSNFRGNIRPAVAAMLAASDRPEEKMNQALENYRILKQDFWRSEYLALVAFLLTDIAPVSQVEEKAGRGKTIYKRMQKEHPFLTSSEDSVFAVLMAFSEKSDDQLIDDMEAAYARLKARFSFFSNSMQAVSQVLALSDGNPEELADRVIDLYDALRANGVKYGREYHMSALAALAMLDMDRNQLVTEIQEVDEFLSRQKCYGFLGPGKAVRAMHAAMLVSDQYANRERVDVAAMTGTLSLMIAQQVATCAAVSASSTTAASSSSHS